MTTEDRKWIREQILNSDFFKKYAYEHTWISGSSTVVYPLTIWPEDGIREIDIDIQLDRRKSKGRYAKFRKLLSALRRRFPKMEGRFVRLDGSCPDYYAITIWKDDLKEGQPI